MKRMLAYLLAFLLAFGLVACVPQNLSNETYPTKDQSDTESDGATTIADIEPTYPMPTFSAVSLNDEAFIDYIEYNLATELEGTESIIVESVKAVYISQEYIDELAYNSLENTYFGFKLSELDADFGEVEYAFTVENGETVAVPISEFSYDDTSERIIKNTAIGAGVIVLCVVVSIVTGGVGAPVAVSAAHMIFTCAATSAAGGAAAGVASGGVFSGANKFSEYYANNEEVDWKEVGKVAAVGASEGFKWGAIVGAATGAVSGAVQVSAAAKNVGKYGDVVKANASKLKKAGKEVHHVLPDAVSGTPRGEGLAIKMSKADHRLLTSTGSSKEAIAFRAEIENLIKAGKLKEAYAMGIDDIIEHTGNKYLAEITQLKVLTGLF